MKKSWLVLWLLALSFGLASCASRQMPLNTVNGYRAVDFTEHYDPQHSRPLHPLASLWPGESARNLVADHRARQVNDLVTIDIIEDSSAKGSADTKTSRQSQIGMGVSGLLGFEQTLARERPSMNLDTLVGAKTNNTFDGKAETTRSTKVVSTMTCTVVDLLPNGNMLIRGKRMIQVNGEDQIITLSGIIRPEDVTSENVVQSIRVADARITYLGVGVLADKQKPGWMTRALDNVWPF